MPTKIKVIVSLLLLVLAGLTALYEISKGMQMPAYVALFLGAFMVFSIWIFPDVNREDKEERDPSRNP